MRLECLLCVSFKGEKEKERKVKLTCGSSTQVVKHLESITNVIEKRMECELHVQKKNGGSLNLRRKKGHAMEAWDQPILCKLGKIKKTSENSNEEMK